MGESPTADIAVQANRELPGVLSLAKACGFEQAHAFQVARLALDVFDQAAGIHGLGRPARRLLLAAALLHDVGLCRGVKGHHKTSREIILSQRPESLSPEEGDVVALVCRYHRKAHPSADHEPFARLSAEERDLVRKLAALLRIADGLDRPHSSAVEGLTVTGTARQTTVALSAAGPVPGEIFGAERKSGLFEEVFGRVVRIVAL